MTRKSDALLERLGRLHPKLIDLSLGRIERLLAALGNPHLRFPPVIHIAGTNGKGSTVAFMRSMAAAAGLKAHVYTSPHLVRFAERIVVAGQEITEDALVDALEACEAANDRAPITFFEIGTAAAFHAFGQVSADLVLLETGLGGRFDATNVIPRPAATGITPVAMDHMDFLGDTLDKIAFEKAGILKSGVPCVLASQAPAADAVIRQTAADVGASIIDVGDHGDIDVGRPALHGVHQMANARMAALCLQVAGIDAMDADAIRIGSETAEWPARLQRLRGGRLSGSLPAPVELWLDGGHNPAAAEALAAEIASWPHLPTDLVLGMMANRDPVDFVAPFRALVRRVVTVPVPDANGHDPQALSDSLRETGMMARPAASLEEALGSLAMSGAPARVLIAGSLYLAGAALQAEQGESA